VVKIKNIYNASSAYFKNPYFGFTQGHAYLSSNDLKLIEKEIGKNDAAGIECFERMFSGLVGDGQSVCFAAGRMGFYAVMEALEIGKGDEVVLQAATCSVMANAVLRKGATPVYADIDSQTFGSCVHAIEKVLSGRTRLIVAQHSFGIPCDILPIGELARRKKIFLLEDCALTLGSKIHGINCGDFGEASLFSTDHTKPINTIIGGMIYTKSKKLHAQLKAQQSQAGELPVWKQESIWKQLLFERKYYRPDKCGKAKLISPLRSKLGLSGKPYLEEDYEAASSRAYPYPAKMPSFLARLGMQELNNWSLNVRTRKKFLEKLLEYFSAGGNRDLVPKVYSDSSIDIVPLRFAWHQKEGERLRGMLRGLIDVDMIWFRRPLIGTRKPLDALLYRAGSCPISERVCPDTINIPCCIDEAWHAKFFSELDQFTMSKQ
jgi:dTDP-4-amino-4,6-dideoxygalactose transaminase